MNDLIRLYRIFNPSGKEQAISEFVVDKLNKLGIKDFEVTEDGQIYKFTDKPLICAHMDSVSTKRARGIVIEGDIIKGKSNLGCDDKNGVWILLRMLEQRPDLSFIFSTEEEVGGAIHKLPLSELKSNYALIFDRRGSGDIIGTMNDYCCDDLEDDILSLAEPFGYSECRGVFSDCDTLMEFIPCVNLSCGYYKAHTDKEFTVLSELENALNLGICLVDGLDHTKKYELPERKVWKWGGKGYAFATVDYPDWLCLCDKINDGDDWVCTGCGLSYFQGMVMELDDFVVHGDDGVCPVCGEYLSDVWNSCNYCWEQTLGFADAH